MSQFFSVTFRETDDVTKERFLEDFQIRRSTMHYASIDFSEISKSLVSKVYDYFIKEGTRSVTTTIRYPYSEDVTGDKAVKILEDLIKSLDENKPSTQPQAYDPFKPAPIRIEMSFTTTNDFVNELFVRHGTMPLDREHTAIVEAKDMTPSQRKLFLMYSQGNCHLRGNVFSFDSYLDFPFIENITGTEALNAVMAFLKKWKRDKDDEDENPLGDLDDHPF